MARQQSNPKDLFCALSDDETRQLSEWGLESVELERERRHTKLEFSDEQLTERLVANLQGGQLAPDAIDSYRRLQQISADELARLIEIQKLYKASSPFATGRIDIYKSIARLAPWDDRCLIKISAEYEEMGESLEACGWLEKALRVNPNNSSIRAKWESLSESTASTRRRFARRRSIRYGTLGCLVLVVAWSSGYRITWDQSQVLAAVARMQDTTIPADVVPNNLIRHVFTGYERITFSNPHGASYVVLVSSPYRKLKHALALGTDTAADTSAESQTFRFTIRGQPAEFLYEKTDYFESVRGYFQGKEFPVSLRARFEFSDRDVYAEGGAPEWIQSLDQAPVEG